MLLMVNGLFRRVETSPKNDRLLAECLARVRPLTSVTVTGREWMADVAYGTHKLDRATAFARWLHGNTNTARTFRLVRPDGRHSSLKGFFGMCGKISTILR